MFYVTDWHDLVEIGVCISMTNAKKKINVDFVIELVTCAYKYCTVFSNAHIIFVLDIITNLYARICLLQ